MQELESVLTLYYWSTADSTILNVISDVRRPESGVIYELMYIYNNEKRVSSQVSYAKGA